MIQVRHQCMEGDVRVGEAEEKHVSGSKQEKENCDKTQHPDRSFSLVSSWSSWNMFLHDGLEISSHGSNVPLFEALL